MAQIYGGKLFTSAVSVWYQGSYALIEMAYTIPITKTYVILYGDIDASKIVILLILKTTIVHKLK